MSARSFGTAGEPQTESTSRSIADQARDAASTISEKTKNVASSVADTVADAAHAVKDRASQLASSVTETAGEVAQRVGRRAEGFANDVGDMISRHPLPSLCAGLGLGFLIAQFVRRQLGEKEVSTD